MNVFEFTDKLADILVEDKELQTLLNVDSASSPALLASKYRRRDQDINEFSSNDLDFIAFYFVDADSTQNAYMNKGLLRIDVYTKRRKDAAKIRMRIVDLIHVYFDERVVAEGQKNSGVKDIYKYRLEYTPLVFN